MCFPDAQLPGKRGSLGPVDDKGKARQRLGFGQKRGPTGPPVGPSSPGPPGSYVKSTKALFSVIHTPQAMGMPTASHARIEVALSCHRPIPIEPEVMMAAACERACRAATSSGFMNQCEASGRTRKLHRKPTTSIPARMYMVK